MRKCIIYLLLLLPLFVFASNDDGFVVFHYNIKSLSKTISDAQCESALNKRLYYNIVNDKPIYIDDSKKHPMSYRRETTTYLDQNKRLFTGILQFYPNGTKRMEHDSFMLDIMRHTIQGSFYIKNYCTGNIIGVQQKMNNWKHPSQSKDT